MCQIVNKNYSSVIIGKHTQLFPLKFYLIQFIIAKSLWHKQSKRSLYLKVSLNEFYKFREVSRSFGIPIRNSWQITEGGLYPLAAYKKFIIKTKSDQENNTGNVVHMRCSEY